jgi:hypothetical protein
MSDTPLHRQLTWRHNADRKEISVSVAASDQFGELRIDRIPNGLGGEEWSGDPWAFIIDYEDDHQQSSFELNTKKMRALHAAIGKLLEDRTDAEIAAELGAPDADED